VQHLNIQIDLQM